MIPFIKFSKTGETTLSMISISGDRNKIVDICGWG